ncbi:hypothetical protein AtNW77_Chr4g0281231 [Arabidopsis thaliana]
MVTSPRISEAKSYDRALAYVESCVHYSNPQSVCHLWKHNNLAQFVDLRLQSYDMDEVMKTIKVEIFYTSRAASDRPPMLAVVSMLEGLLSVEVEMQALMAVLSDEEQSPDLLRMMADIDEEFELQEIIETLERYPVSTKGK